MVSNNSLRMIRNCLKGFTCINCFNTHDIPRRWALLSSCTHEEMERLNNLPKVISKLEFNCTIQKLLTGHKIKGVWCGNEDITEN